MIISDNIKLFRIVMGTWKFSLYILITATATYIFNESIVKKAFELPAIIPTMIGTALAFFIGFNNSQAYGRWWEARIIWGGIVNNSRTWARDVLSFIPDNHPTNTISLSDLKQKLIKRHIAFLYALKEDLRRTKNYEYTKYLSQEDVNAILPFGNKQNSILLLQGKDLEVLYSKNYVDGFRFNALNSSLIKLCEDMGKSERIKNTVFPVIYNYYTRLFIWFLIVAVTMVISNLMGAYSITLGFLIGYIFMTIHTMGELLMNPFESIATGIPLDQITRSIEITLLEMMGEKSLPEAVKSVNGEYVM